MSNAECRAVVPCARPRSSQPAPLIGWVCANIVDSSAQDIGDTRCLAASESRSSVPLTVVNVSPVLSCPTRLRHYNRHLLSVYQIIVTVGYSSLSMAQTPTILSFLTVLVYHPYNSVSTVVLHYEFY